MKLEYKCSTASLMHYSFIKALLAQISGTRNKAFLLGNAFKFCSLAEKHNANFHFGLNELQMKMKLNLKDLNFRETLLFGNIFGEILCHLRKAKSWIY